ncbi:MAG TPA: hypothetical protein VHJ20_20110 [Polyangia bacterium]|nr:hypothetical protein [Polyangia bacterium]
MRYLVQVTPSFEAANKLDAGPGGPGPLFGYIAERFKPEAFYTAADRRTAYWVIDFVDAASMVEFTHIAVTRAGAEPTLVPVLTGPEARDTIPKAAAEARRAP